MSFYLAAVQDCRKIRRLLLKFIPSVPNFQLEPQSGQRADQCDLWVDFCSGAVSMESLKAKCRWKRLTSYRFSLTGQCALCTGPVKWACWKTKFFCGCLWKCFQDQFPCRFFSHGLTRICADEIGIDYIHLSAFHPRSSVAIVFSNKR